MLSTTEDAIREAFVKAAGKEGCVERVKKLRDYAFVHFREREDAQRALDIMNGSCHIPPHHIPNCFLFLSRAPLKATTEAAFLGDLP